MVLIHGAGLLGNVQDRDIGVGRTPIGAALVFENQDVAHGNNELQDGCVRVAAKAAGVLLVRDDGGDLSECTI